MRPCYILTCCLFLCGHAFSQLTFSITGSPDGARYDDIYFVNDSIGWGVNANGYIYKTVDAGTNWEMQHESFDYFRSVEFFDANVGLAGTLDYAVYRTEDGGDTWNNIIDSFPPEVVGICGMDVVDANTIFACGNVLEPAFILRSYDRGQTWEYKDMNSVSTYLIDIYFLNPDTGFCAGLSSVDAEGAILLKTTDGGDTWEPVLKSMAYTDTFWKIFQVNKDTLVMTIENFGSEHLRYAYSYDRGETWTIKEVLPTFDYAQMIGFFNDTIGYYGNNNLYQTLDGGTTWTPVDTFTVYTSFNRFFKVRPGLAYAASAFIYKIQDTSVVYVDVENAQTQEHPRQWLSDIAPNPATGHIHFTYELKFKTRMYLEIINQQGQIMQRMYHGWQYPGKYEVDEDIHLQPGMYTLILYTYDGLLSKKFVVVK